MAARHSDDPRLCDQCIRVIEKNGKETPFGVTLQRSWYYTGLPRV